MAPIRVLLAMSSRLLRARFQQLLSQMPDITVIGEAVDGAQAAYQARQGRPDFVLCDPRMLEESALAALFALGPDKVPFKVVLVAAHALMPQHQGIVPVTAVLSADSSGEAILARLRQLAGAVQARPAPPMVGMRERFMIAEPNPLAQGDLDRNATSRLPGAADQLVRSLSAPTDLLTRRLDRTDTPRRDEAIQARIADILGGGTPHGDSATGLRGIDDLSNSLRALPRTNHPAAILVVDVGFPHSSHPSEADQQNVLRSATAVLRANVRHLDLVFHLEEIAFAVLMPGMEMATSARSLRRLRGALDNFRRPNARRPEILRVAMGIGFWEPGMPPAHPLQQGWQGMLADRNGAG